MTAKQAQDRTNKRPYTWIPDVPDHRDHRMALRVTKLPKAADLRAKMPPVVDQGQLGSCTGNALAGAMGYLHPDLTASRLFIYYNERALEGTVRQDAGAMIRDGVKTLNKLGVCQEAKWPYAVAKFKTKPTKACFSLALSGRISSYERIDSTSLAALKQCLADGFPFVFGFSVYDSFEGDEVARTGVVPMPAKSEQLLGGHAVLAVGYDDASQRFVVRNSWGADWGQQGYFTIPYAYLTTTSLADDFWTLRK